ncbi:hypothetical protein OIU77_000650 [Salix suchowensis]|uniref:Uncharacterized protein n=1 Tax=Salix suchowensis TaxID=1278906 RepID=A0ABQ9B7J2_9ROSI|nr:hypothetical protein OIU77_000650 [Salix suchowensis]
MGFEEYSKNKLVDTIHFMEILTLKDSVKKDTFFHKLPNVAEQLPCQIVLKRQVLQTIVKLFSSNNHVIRARLVQHMESHCQHKLLMSNFLNVLF